MVKVKREQQETEGAEHGRKKSKTSAAESCSKDAGHSEGSTASGKRSATTPHQWDSFYNDPSLDLVLRAADGTHFRASSHMLKRYSTVFENAEGVSPTNPIVLPFPSLAISTFLSQTSQPDPPPPDIVKYSSAVDYRELCVRFGYKDKALLLRASRALQTAQTHYPFEALIHFAKENNVAGARTALTALGEGHNRQAALIRQSFLLHAELSRLPPAWFGPVLKLFMQEEGKKVKRIYLRWPQKGDIGGFTV